MDVLRKEPGTDLFLAYMVVELLLIKGNGKCLTLPMKVPFVLSDLAL